ncbi:PREDICTED: ESF1 homolog [Wasmannia auropunctata]|uniref:ESF1 homolog n=1 Tax=Wasmannia auropunctata TaxID=64793 RepID=UPI0005EEDF33|nr:PREDICTED: ESF1 homolog [Wasmannia auropunctata]XP_011693871.1 PREDICTED: ESF1 homolog [Wasmannia auropunctata]
MDEMLKDARFAHIARDPKFRRIPKAERKVKIDHRFKGMFKDEKFAVKYTIDKRGRPVSRTTTEDLRKYYDLSSSEDEADEDASVPSTSKKDSEKEVKDIKEKKKGKKEATEEIESKTDSAKDSSNKKNKDDRLSSKKDLSELETKEECPDDEESSGEDSASDSEDESVEKEFSQVELDKNDKQLQKRRTNENGRLTNEIKEKLKDLTVNYARGEGVLLTDSSSEEESSEASDIEEEIEHNWGELDKDAETTDEITRRLAICNMDWDRIRAVDLMILLNSFLPSGGLIQSVTIYPSEFGLQRMKEEEINGPTELKNKANGSEDEIEDDNEEGSKYHMEKLRQYQLNRLKYYYAVAEFDSAETANKVYTECDGIEYESTATRLDLRFIPDDMTFDQESKEVCTEIPEPVKYQPRQFTTTALQQIKVELTWDETNPDRQEFTQKLNSGKLQEVDENDLQTYLASGSEDDSDTEEKKDVTEETNDNSESEENDDPIGKYKSLLKTIEEEEETKKNKDVELEFSWGLDTKEKAENLVKQRMKDKEELTPFEQYLEKRKAKKKAKREERKKLKEENKECDSEDSLPSDVDMNDKYFAEEFKNSKSSRRKGKKDKNEAEGVIDSPNEQEESRRKAELELLLMDQDEDGKKHFNMKQIEENATMSKSKRKRLNKKKKVQEAAKEDDFEVDVKDPRFAALYSSHHFNIDPADPRYRKTKGTEVLVNEKLKRRADNEVHTENDKQSKRPRTDEKLPTELQALVKSVKKKTQNITQPIKG